MLYLKNIVIAVGISFIFCLQAEIEVYPVLDFSLSVKSYNISGSSIGLVDPKNINLVFEISFLCCPRAEIYVFKLKFRSGVRHLEFVLPVRPCSTPDGSFGFSLQIPF